MVNPLRVCRDERLSTPSNVPVVPNSVSSLFHVVEHTPTGPIENHHGISTALNHNITTHPTCDPHLKNIKYINSSCLGLGAPVWQTFTLATSNLIYAITCKACGKIYVRQTGTTLKQRRYQHLCNIRSQKTAKLLYTVNPLIVACIPLKAGPL